MRLVISRVAKTISRVPAAAVLFIMLILACSGFGRVIMIYDFKFERNGGEGFWEPY